ncbi:MAG TPA: PAS domain S-box protein [Candidatus Methylomirabilis sp.]|nr:PAS domain S-box protein [Candidatus Methylomirabilis sp.]
MLGVALKSQEHFRQIADHLSVVIALSNADLSQFLFVNRAYEKIWGRPIEGLYADSLSFVDGVHPDDRERLKQALHGLIAGQPIDGIECRVIRPDGSTCWVLCRGFPVRDAQGQIIRLVGSAEDITVQKDAAEELRRAFSRTEAALRAIRESEDRYRDLVENSSDLICTHDLQGMLLSVNETPLRILGYSREEMLNKPLRDFVTPEGRAHCDTYLEQVQREGVAKGFLPVVTKSGEVRLWEYNNSLRKDGVSSPIVRGLAHDVTEQKRAESALRRSEEKFAKAFRSSPVEMMISTVDGGRLLEVNETLERNLGYRREELIGHSTIQLGLWTDPAQREAIVEEVRKQGRVVNREIRIRAKSGEIGYKLYSAELMHINEEPCLLAVSEDITERKRAQENLLRSEAFLAEGQRLSHTGSWSWNPVTQAMFWSKETFRIFDLDPATTKPTLDTVLQHLHPEDRFLFAKLLERIVRDPCDSEGDYRIVMRDGIIRYVHCVARPVFDASGHLLEFVGTAMDVSERKKTEQELRRLSGQLLRLHDEERRGIARDLHDSTGQGLVALETTLSQVQAHVSSSNRTARKLISESIALAKECLREVRTLSYVLYPPMLEQAGLEDALRHFREGFVKRSGIQVQLEISPAFARLRRETELALFRIVQESLANIQRHAGSQTAEIRVDRQPGIVVLEVRDHGCGISGKEPRSDGEFPFSVGVGIASMQERIKQVGGRLEIKSGNSGTTVWAAVPVDG